MLRYRPRRQLNLTGASRAPLHAQPKSHAVGPAPKCGHPCLAQPSPPSHAPEGNGAVRSAQHTGRPKPSACPTPGPPTWHATHTRSEDPRAGGAPPKGGWGDLHERVAPHFSLFRDTYVHQPSLAGSLSSTTVCAEAPKNLVLTGLCAHPGDFPGCAGPRNALRGRRCAPGPEPKLEPSLTAVKGLILRVTRTVRRDAFEGTVSRVPSRGRTRSTGS